MALRAEVLRALKAAGATMEMVLAAIETEQACERADAEAADAARRRKAAEKKQRQRAAKAEMSPPVPGTRGDDRGQRGHGGTTPNDPSPLPPRTPPITPTPNTPSDPDGSASGDAGLVADPRDELFGRGKLAVRKMTGRALDGCGSLIGKWLKAADDDAVTVLAVIDDAISRELAHPIPWIETAIRKEAQRNGSGSTDLFGNGSARRERGGSVNSAISAAVARHAARDGFGPGGGADDHRHGNGADRGSGGDDPTIEDAEWTPTARYRAAHH